MSYVEDVLEELGVVRKEILESWARGAFTEETMEGTIQMNAKWIGKVEMLDDIVELLVEKRKEYDDD